MEHTITIDIPRTFKFNFSAFAYLQDVDPAIFKKLGKIDLNAIRTLIIGGLRHEKKYMPSEVDAMLDIFMDNGGKLPELEVEIVKVLSESSFIASMSPRKSDEGEAPKN